MTKEKQQKDDIETMKILFNADINELCNQRRFNDAREMEGIRDRLIQALEQQPRWIPVTERLPKDGQKVLVTKRSDNIIDIDTSIFYHASAFWKHFVIAWMPLPEPYKENAEMSGGGEDDRENS